MTAAKKSTVTVIGVVAALGAIFGLWPVIRPVLDWLAPILSYPNVQNVAVAWLIATFTLPMPWVLPKRLEPIWTRSFSAAVSFATAVAVHMALSWPLSRTNVVYAVGMAGMGAVVWNLGITALYLHFRPAATPESLQP